MKIEELGYVPEMRQRMGLDEDCTDLDKDIECMTPMDRIGLIAGWYLGSDSWAGTFKEWCESQGVYLTTNPNADGVID